MHIAILSTAVNFHTQKWAENLTQAGQKVSIFSLEKDNFQHPDIQHIVVPATFTHKGKPTYLSYLDGRALRKQLSIHQIDLVLAINATPFGVWATKSGFQPTIIFAVGADILEYPPQKQTHTANRTWQQQEFGLDFFFSRQKNRLAKSFFRYQVNKALHVAKGIMADNRVLTKAIENWFHIQPEKILLNRGGIEPALFEREETVIAELKQHFHIPPNATVIISPRGMKPIYQADIIFEAFETLVKEKTHKDTYFIMLSAGYEVPKSIEQRAEKLMKEYDNFFFEKNMLSRQKISQLWHLIDIFISAPVYDGYSAAVAEGRYMGAIPVVNQTLATMEILTHQENAWFVEPFNHYQLVKELKELMLEKDKWKTIFAANNKQWIADNSIMEKSIQHFLNFAEKIMLNLP